MHDNNGIVSRPLPISPHWRYVSKALSSDRAVQQLRVSFRNDQFDQSSTTIKIEIAEAHESLPSLDSEPSSRG